MDVKQYYADAPPTIVKLAVKPHFDALTEQQKLYAHHISRSVTLKIFPDVLFLPAPRTFGECPVNGMLSQLKKWCLFGLLCT
jgi:hypothetical protein